MINTCSIHCTVDYNRDGKSSLKWGMVHLFGDGRNDIILVIHKYFEILLYYQITRCTLVIRSPKTKTAKQQSCQGMNCFPLCLFWLRLQTLTLGKMLVYLFENHNWLHIHPRAHLCLLQILSTTLFCVNIAQNVTSSVFPCLYCRWN